ncbi:MAG: hypothetical protein LC659_09180 [Myxococcales bacterium]|nr:hypothetical protein [Myxococcales bacterium]
MNGSAKAKWLNSTRIGIGIASLFSDVGREMATTAMVAALLILLFVREKPHAPQPRASLCAGMRSLPHQYKKFLVGLSAVAAMSFVIVTSLGGAIVIATTRPSSTAAEGQP